MVAGDRMPFEREKVNRSLWLCDGDGTSLRLDLPLPTSHPELLELRKAQPCVPSLWPGCPPPHPSSPRRVASTNC